MISFKIKKHPILRILNGNLDYTSYKESLRIGIKNPDGTDDISQVYVWKAEEVKTFLKANLKEFSQNIFVPAESFMNAVYKSRDSLILALQKEPDFMFSNLKHTSGIMIFRNVATFFKIDKEKKVLTAISFIDDVLGSAYQNISLHESSIKEGTYKVYVPVGLTLDAKGYENIAEVRKHADIIPLVTAFRTYADHEIKKVCGKSSSKLNNVVYNNLNKNDIQVIDSSWYTSITRTEGFMVRGHLRMQPCGPNMSERKLIYIDSFEKHGYTRRAKMLPRNNPSISTITEEIFS